MGGAWRWQDRSAIGFPFVRSVLDSGEAVEILDRTNPFWGPSESAIDAWLSYRRKIFGSIGWKLQLNVRNVLNDDDLIPVKANPNGEVAVYRIPTPITWQLSSTFDF